MKTYSLDRRFRESLARARALTAPPNVLYIVLDGLPFGAIEPFGGSIETPNLARLAQRGLRYVNFHTAALCSPACVSLLSGRDHPCASVPQPLSKAALPAMLRPHGYASIALGEWHGMTNPAGVATDGSAFGFDRCYGQEECKSPEELATKAIEWLGAQSAVEPGRPWLCYLAFGAGGTQPVAKPWIEKYRGKFDLGWDEYESQMLERQRELGLTPSRSLSVCEQVCSEPCAVEAARLESFAARVSHTDAQLGRLLGCLERTGQLDNTLLFAVVSGAPRGALPSAWQRAMEAGRSGEMSPLIVHWPRGIRAQNQLRAQAHQWTDLVPTVLAAVGIEAPSEIASVPQAPLEGVAMNDSFDDDAPTRPCAAARGRTRYTFRHGAVRLPSESTPDLRDRAWELTAEIDIPARGASGPIAALGGALEGWSLYLSRGVPCFCYNVDAREYTYLRACEPLAPGEHTLRYVFELRPDASGLARLYVDGQRVAQSEIRRPPARSDMISAARFDIGQDHGAPVGDEYAAFAAFSGSIIQIKLDIAAERCSQLTLPA